MNPSPDIVLALYHSGALICAAIVAVYLLLRWGVGHIPWIEEPQHAHYATALLTALGVLALPAAAGHGPTLSMVLTAVGTLVALLLPGIAQATASAQDSKQKQSGRARLTLLAMLGLVAVVLFAAVPSCAWWQKTGKGAAASGGKAAAACAVGDVEKYSGQVIAALGTDSFTQAVDSIGKQNNLGQDALNCLVQTVLAVMAAGMPTTSEPSVVVLHARAYLAAHGGAS